MGESWWDDFSNNLATDLAPLIALFGEAPTKQYLSECLTTLDIIVFACAPLGVLTAVVSAIRVCGTPSLKAFIGRGKEGAGIAEAELCSSTSRDVCELYSDGGIARVFGRPKLLEIVHDPQAPRKEFYSASRSEATAGIYSFKEYMERENGKKEWTCDIHPMRKHEESLSDDEAGTITEERPAKFAPNPNLSFNIGIKPLPRGWFVAAAIIGIVSQAFVLVWAALTRYHYQWIRHSVEDNYAVPFTIVGTIFLCSGIALCAKLIEAKTGEQIYRRLMEPGSNGGSKLYWVQPGNQVIGDQVFDSFAYSEAGNALNRYITSWKIENEELNMLKTWIAVSASAIGFVFQFLGLRACHSSVAVIQLGVTTIMSVIRAGLRTQRLRREDNLMWAAPHFFQGQELDYLALTIGMAGGRKDAAPKLATAWETSYLSEIKNRATWSIRSAPEFIKVIKADLGTSPFTSTPIRHYQREGDGFKLVEKHRRILGGPPTLTGFSIMKGVRDSSQPLSEKQLNDAEQEVLSWILTEQCAEHEHGQECPLKNCEIYSNVTLTSVIYRSRLARMTGVEATESERSSYWDRRFVSVRDTAIILGNVIEDTMHILFDDGWQRSVKLSESWKPAFRIFWTLRCSSRNSTAKDYQHGEIPMSLRREIDPKGSPYGPWRCDNSELEAVLGLWSWALKEPPREQEEAEAYSRRIGSQRTSRILSASTSQQTKFGKGLELKMWRESGAVRIQEWHIKVPENQREIGSEGMVEIHAQIETSTSLNVQNSVWWRDDDVFVTRFGEPPCNSNEQMRFFGWCNAEESLCCGLADVLAIESECSLVQNCALEIYSVFLEAILQIVKDVGGPTEVKERGNHLFAKNSTVDDIQRILVTRGLCGANDSFACVIPVLSRCHKLPLGNDFVSKARESARKHTAMKDPEKAKELIDWSIYWLYAKIQGTSSLLHSSMEVINDLRLSILSACDTSLHFVAQQDSENSALGVEWIISLLTQYSEDKLIKDMPLVWIDSGTVPKDRQEKPQQISLADAMWSYGEAMLWLIKDRRQTALGIRLEDTLKDHLYELRSTPESIFQAIQKSDLSATLFLLQRPNHNQAETTQLLARASLFGWYMVVEALVGMGAEIYDQSDTRKNALHYAAEIGDVNTVRTLIRAGAVSNLSWNSNQHLALHGAVRQGYLVIVNDLRNNSETKIDHADSNGDTPMGLAIKSGNPSTVQILIHKAHRNDLNHYHTRAPVLHQAIKEDVGDVVDVLLKNNAVDVNFKHSTVTSTPPLVCAVRLRREVIFEKILSSERVDADCADKNNRTALWWAAALGLDSYVQKLLKSRKVFHPERIDACGDTALSMAVRSGHLEMVQQLLTLQSPHTVSLKAIFIAAKNGHIPVVEKMLPLRVKDKRCAQRLLENRGLETVWHDIKKSSNWQHASETEEVQQNYDAEIGELRESDLTWITLIADEGFHLL